ncbi:MAG: hypothetical protein SA339_03060 [Methanomassiliicoccus sp.]|nr:hypothetical protein [Methanomassiliicoccus sp.]
MNRKVTYKSEIRESILDYLAGDDRTIVNYLASNSNLPGPRGNLEMAEAFADLAGEMSIKEPIKIWKLAADMAAIPPEAAPVNDPMEMVPFCGTVAIGAIASAQEGLDEKAFALLRKMADDPRWRTREAVAMGLQRMIAKDGRAVMTELESWIKSGEWLRMRAAMAGVAEPALLKDPELARRALDLHKGAIAEVQRSGNRKDEGFRTLRQALGYSLSVVVSECPGEGFRYIDRIAHTSDPDIRWIVKENLKKKRLTKSYPREVAEVTDILNGRP